MDDMTIPLTAGATLHPLVLPARAGAGSSPRFRDFAEVRNDCFRDWTGRDDDALSATELLPTLRSDRYSRRLQWSVLLDGRTVGIARLDIALDGDGDTAFWYVALIREVQGRGIGTAAAGRVEEFARREGVRELQLWTEHPRRADLPTGSPLLTPPTGFGGVPRDRAARLLLRLGHTLEQVDRVSEYRWQPSSEERLHALRAEAGRYASGYRVVSWMLPTPVERVPGYAWMKSRMSTDAPSAGLAIPEEVWDAERIAEHDRRWADQGTTVQVTAAEHVATGELCAFTELSIADSADSVTHQEDTLVLDAHRGHRLGLLVKTASMLSWRERFPDSSRIVTYNAEENRPMLSINETIGFAPIAYEGAWKKVLT